MSATSHEASLKMPEPDEIRHEEDRIIIYATYVVKVDMGIEFDRTNPIGEGTYATVYAGTASLGTIEMGGKFSVVAVKVFKPAVLADSKRYKYVLNEIQNGEKRAQIAALQSVSILYQLIMFWDIAFREYCCRTD